MDNVGVMSLAIQLEDRTTMDMFQRGVGRPKSNPFPREVQHRMNKRAQRERDRKEGLKRLEVKLEGDLIEKVDWMAEVMQLSRAEMIKRALRLLLAKESRH